jgi:pyruvate/2-oxoglutarate dehydrogenase complex dihydrolipoamide dehydrogenase (E3) component
MAHGRRACAGREDRGITSADTAGFATLVGDPRGRIVGATVVGPRAGETIGEVVARMAAGAELSTIVRSPHAYPTWNEDLTAASLEGLQASLARIRP